MLQSTYLKNQDADWVKGTDYDAPPTIRFTLHDGDPSLTGANEISFTARIPATTYGAIATVDNKREFSVDEALTFVNSPLTGEATYWGAWDSLTGGNFLGGGQFVDETGDPTAIALTSGDDVTVASGVIRFAYQRGVFTDYFIDLKLNWLRGTAFATAPTNIYANLGLTLTSVGGGTISDIAREIVAFGANTTALDYIRITSNADVDYGLAPSELPFDSFGYYDDLTDGNLLWISQFPLKTYALGDALLWESGKISVDF
jgi:hypothetical protein